jgi:hypothetical protein
MDDPGDWLAKLPSLLQAKPNVIQGVGVIGDGPQPGRREFVLDINDDESLHGFLLRNILGIFIRCYNVNQQYLANTEISSVW